MSGHPLSPFSSQTSLPDSPPLFPPDHKDPFELFNMEASTMADMAVQIQPLETSQDWAPWSKGIRTKLEWHNLYKYIQTDLARPTDSDNQAFLRQEKWEADQARTKAILRTSCSDVVQNKINEHETADTTVFEIYTFLKEKYSKQNVFSLDTLHKTITKAKLTDYSSIKEYGKAVTDAGKELNQLGHPVES